MRKKIDFNQEWEFCKGEEAVKEKITLPHTWNALDGQDGGNDYFRGTCTYTKEFQTPEVTKDESVILEFEGAAMTAELSLNGTCLTTHEDGFSAFRAEITDFLNKDGTPNLLKVNVNNGVNDCVYPQMADFTFYGGIYRKVSMIIVNKNHFELIQDGFDGVKVTPRVSLERQEAIVTVESRQNVDTRVRYTIYEPENSHMPLEDASLVDKAESVSVNGLASAEIKIAHVHLWNGRKDPYLYIVKAELLSDTGEVLDVLTKKFGCRSFYFDKEKGFFLNGNSYPLRGVARHQDRQTVGNALTEEMQNEDMALICEIGANTIRLAHYQHSQYFYDLCDEKGMVVWAEIPYISRHMENGRENTLLQMRELIMQNYNHPSIVCWGLSNEITASGSVTEAIIENHRQLNELCHRLDPTRPTTMAHVFMLETDSPLVSMADICSYNLYYGWYVGELEENEQFFDEFHKKYPEQVIGFSEYGADANVQYQSAHPEKSDYTETYQCVYHEHILKCIEERPYLWATHVWNMFDFGADGREEGGKKGQNQKGLVTFDRKIKKDAFYIYKAYWSEEKFVHLCGKRYADRVEKETLINVYSNLTKVALYVDGKLAEEKEGNYVFQFKVKIEGNHEIMAVAQSDKGTVSDHMCINHVDIENKNYIIASKKSVVNWFDTNENDDTCFSINDKMGDIMQDPVGAAIIGKMMEQARASRGDVAKGAGDNPVLKKMLAQMTVASLLKQAGDALPPEQIKGLNAALQKIKKPQV